MIQGFLFHSSRPFTPYSFFLSSFLIANSCAIHNGEFNILTAKKNSVSIEVTLIPLTDQANKSK